MNKTILLLTLASTFFIPPAVLAHEWRRPPCVLESKTTVTHTAALAYEGGCTLAQPLALGRTIHAYPLMGGKTFEVDYWQGVYQRPALLRDTYRRDFFNSCTGVFEYSENFDGEAYHGMANFPVENPNLSDTVKASFELVPMTDEEAVQALVQAKVECEK